MDTILKIGIGVAVIGILAGFIFGLLPREFSFFTLSDFNQILSGIGNFLGTGLGLFFSFVNVDFLLISIRIMFYLLVLGLQIKLVMWVVKIFNA